MDMDFKQLQSQVNILISSHQYDEIMPLLLKHKYIIENNNDLAMVFYLCSVHKQEKEAGQASLFSKVSNVEELIERYTCLKFYLRRIDFDFMDEGLEDFFTFLVQCEISSYELLAAIDFTVINKDKVLKVISGK